MHFPDKFCLWNDKPKTVIPFLELKILPELNIRLRAGRDIINALKHWEIQKMSCYLLELMMFHYIFYHIYQHSILPNSKLTIKQKVENKKLNGSTIDTYTLEVITMRMLLEAFLHWILKKCIELESNVVKDSSNASIKINIFRFDLLCIIP